VIASTVGSPLALAQGVSGDGRADAQFQRHVFALGQPPHCLDRRIGIAFGIFRQRFDRHVVAIGRPCHHIGKRAAAIDPELPGCHESLCRVRALACAGDMA
jgi:hypothetical protein